MAKTKQKSTAAKNVAVFFIVFTLLLVLICLGLKAVFKNRNVTPSVLGYSFFIQDNDYINDIEKNSLVLAVNGSMDISKTNYAFLCDNVDGQTNVVRLVGMQTKDNMVEYMVCYDKTPNTVYTVTTSDVIGEAKSSFPMIGKIIVFATNPFGIAVIALVPIILMIIIEIFCAISAASQTSAYKKSSKQAEESKPEAEYDDVVKTPAAFLTGQESFAESGYSVEEIKKAEEIKNNQILSVGKTITVSRSEIAEAAKKKSSEPSISSADKLVDEARNSSEKSKGYEKVSDEDLRLNAGDFSLNTIENHEFGAKVEIEELKKAKSSSSSISDLVKLMEEQEAKLKGSINKK